MSSPYGEDDREPQPWYQQSAPQLEQAESPPQAEGQTADERALSNYISPGEGRASLVGMLGGQPADSGAGTGLAGGSMGGGMGALMLPLLMAQMQQQQRQATSPLSAFANAYSGATGQRSPLQAPQGPSQFQQFQMIHEVMKDQALEKERGARQEMAQQNLERLKDAATDKKAKDEKADILRTGNAQMALSMRSMGDDRPEIRAFAADNFLSGAAKLGYEIPDPEQLRGAIAKGDLSPKRIDDVLKNLARGVPREVIETWPGMSPAIVDTLVAPNGPVAIMAQDTAVERKKKAAEANIEEAKLIEHKNPEFFKASPDLIPYIQGAARSSFGTTYDQLDDKAKALAMQTGMLNAKAAKMEEYKKQQEILFGKQADLARLHGNIQLGLAKAEGRGMFAPIGMDKTNIWVDQNGIPVKGDDVLLTGEAALKKGFMPLNQKQSDVVSGLQRAKQEMANMKYLSDQMADRNLYSGSGNWPKGPLMAPVENFYKGTIAPQIAPTDTDRAILKSFEASKTALINIDRQLGTLGVRAFGAYGPQLATLSPTTGKQGVELTLSQTEDALDAQTKLMKLPGTFEQPRIWTAPTIGKKTSMPPPTEATGAPNLTQPPMSKMTFDNAVARLRMQGLPAAQLQAEIDNLRNKYRIIN